MAEIRHLENRHDVIFFCQRWSDLDKFRRLVENDISTAGRVLPFGKFIVMIPEPHATLQGAVTW